jgi:hypothetical protein
MAEPQTTPFDVVEFLAKAGLGRTIAQLKPKQTFFAQGGPADSIFYLQSGRAKLTVVSTTVKKPNSRFSLRASSLERSRSQPWVGCVWQPQLPSPLIQH